MENVHIDMQSPYQRGAEDGTLLGVYLSVMMACSIAAPSVPLLGLLSTLMMVAVPAVDYVMLRRYYVQERAMVPVSSLWMQGIIAFSCAALITFALTFIYMRWINPSYLTDTIESAIAVLTASGDAEMKAMASQITTSIEQGGNPITPITYCFTMIWATVFSGSILSLVMALIVRAIPYREKK